jgi:demethylmenaquinone methyltransferase/2-methoxy-6-polyprenyl-1,4-benzoquinol methylase
MSDTDLLEQQKAYYRARSGEYDDWFMRLGRYDHGEALNRQWFAEVEEVRQALAAFQPTGRVLELAAGTGWWTAELAKYADHVTAVDASAEVLELNRERLDGATNVEYVQGDIFVWQTSQPYDVVFFSFWLSHVPPERFASFWDTVRAALKPRGRVFFIDSRRSETSRAHDNALPSPDKIVATRRLNDGREFDIIKVFYQPETLAADLARLGWNVKVETTENYFLFGAGQPA